MNQVIEKFGRAVQAQLPQRPGAARALLTAGFRLNGWAGRHFDRRKSPARSAMAEQCNRAILYAFSHPQACAMVSLFTPCEMLQAFGLAPMFPEGMACYLSGAGAERAFVAHAEQNGVPSTFCSYHKILIGAAESGVLPAPRFILNTTLACDANTLTFRRLAQFYGVPHLVLDVPFSQDEAAVRDLAGQLRAAAGQIARITGRRLDEDKLRQAVARSGQTLRTYQQYLLARAQKSMPDEMSSEMYAVFALHVLLGTPGALDFAEALLQEARQAPPAGRALRLLWAHILPNLDDAMIQLLDYSARCEILATDVCFDAPPAQDSDPWMAMARRLACNHLNGPAQRRIDALLAAAQRLGPDGVVWFCHWGCKQTAGAGALAKQQLEAAGFPTLVLDGDGCDRGNCPPGQVRTRMEAFLEQLEGRR